nr:hypothetical protein [Tanacetum cinerariifolium]
MIEMAKSIAEIGVFALVGCLPLAVADSLGADTTVVIKNVLSGVHFKADRVLMKLSRCPEFLHINFWNICCH